MAKWELVDNRGVRLLRLVSGTGNTIAYLQKNPGQTWWTVILPRLKREAVIPIDDEDAAKNEASEYVLREESKDLEILKGQIQSVKEMLGYA